MLFVLFALGGPLSISFTAVAAQSDETRAESNETGQQGSNPRPNSTVNPMAGFIDRDCGDFTTHAEAQRFFANAGRGDPHRLDADHDGLACEALP
jgi:hypothetical protein